MKKVSAVLPTIGRIKYLDIAIESILNQTISFDEIIVFDNSLEQNLKQISSFGNNSFIRFLQSGKQLNAIDSWNTAVLSANNEYVTIIGDDDILFPNYSKNIQNLLENASVGILKAYCIDENGDKKGKLIYPNTQLLTSENFRKARFQNKISLFVPGIVFKRELFIKVNGFTNSYIDGFAYSDELLLSQLSVLSKNIAISNEICWKYRIHSDQIAGVKDISNYVNKVTKYIKLYKETLLNLGLQEKEIYQDFSEQDYFNKVCGYGIKLYYSYLEKNENNILFLSHIMKYFIFNNRISMNSRITIAYLTLRLFIGATKLGKFIKGIKIR